MPQRGSYGVRGSRLQGGQQRWAWPKDCAYQILLDGPETRPFINLSASWAPYHPVLLFPHFTWNFLIKVILTFLCVCGVVVVVVWCTGYGKWGKGSISAFNLLPRKCCHNKLLPFSNHFSNTLTVSQITFSKPNFVFFSNSIRFMININNPKSLAFFFHKTRQPPSRQVLGNHESCMHVLCMIKLLLPAV